MFSLGWVTLLYVRQSDVVPDAVIFLQNSGGRRYSGVFIIPSDDTLDTA